MGSSETTNGSSSETLMDSSGRPTCFPKDKSSTDSFRRYASSLPSSLTVDAVPLYSSIPKSNTLFSTGSLTLSRSTTDGFSSEFSKIFHPACTPTKVIVSKLQSWAFTALSTQRGTASIVSFKSPR